VPLNQGNLASSLANIMSTYELTSEDKSLVVMPLFHVHGLMAGQICSFLIVLTHSQLGRLFPALHIFQAAQHAFFFVGQRRMLPGSLQVTHLAQTQPSCLIVPHDSLRAF